MVRTLIGFALMLATGAPREPTQAPAADPARPLQIEAVAFDSRGNPVRDLRAEEIEVWIGGARIPIEMLVAVDASKDERDGRSVVVILDDITVEPSLVPRIRQAARRLVTRVLPGDHVAIVGLEGDYGKTTSDQALLLRRVDEYNVRATSLLRPDDLGAYVLNTLAQVSRQLAEAPGGRKTIVAIGSGWLFDRPIPPPIAGRDLQREWVEVMRAMASAHASLYVIDPAGVGTALATGGSSGFARETGGHAFINTNDVNGAVDRILREASNYYLMTVTDPPIRRKAPLREVDVRSLRRGVTVRARRGIPGGG